MRYEKYENQIKYIYFCENNSLNWIHLFPFLIYSDDSNDLITLNLLVFFFVSICMMLFVFYFGIKLPEILTVPHWTDTILLKT